jgi:hypothetical protein
LLLDLAQDIEDHLPFQSNISAMEITAVYARVGDETNTVELSLLTRAQVSIAPTEKGHHRE